jgi:hypothetical protein
MPIAPSFWTGAIPISIAALKKQVLRFAQNDKFLDEADVSSSMFRFLLESRIQSRFLATLGMTNLMGHLILSDLG